MRIRVARPTGSLDDISRFYEQGVGLMRVTAFRDHDGYAGIVLAAPNDLSQLEFTMRNGARAGNPGQDEHLVLYFDAPNEQEETVARLNELGYAEVTPHNPWWRSRATTFRDPDGWEVVLVRAPQASLRA